MNIYFFIAIMSLAFRLLLDCNLKGVWLSAPQDRIYRVIQIHSSLIITITGIIGTLHATSLIR